MSEPPSSTAAIPSREAHRGRRRVLREWSRPETSAEELTRLAGSPDHQGIVAEVEPYPYADPTSLLADPQALVVALDQVQDPHNLGAICRSAEAAGAAGVVICERRAASVTAAVCKASAGAVEHLPVARVTQPRRLVALAREQGAWIYGADGRRRAHLPRPRLEGGSCSSSAGRRRACGRGSPQSCDVLASIPNAGKVGSLNVSAAAAVLLFAAAGRTPRGARCVAARPDGCKLFCTKLLKPG